MRPFQIGDRVRYIGHKDGVRDPNQPSVPVGATGEVVAYPGLKIGMLAVRFDEIPSNHPSKLWSSKPHWLKLVYDGDEPASWADCAWRPKSLVKA